MSATPGAPSRAALLAHVARLYYLRDVPKREIATRLGMSRFKVARLLDQARAEGVIRFDISDPVVLAEALSSDLQRAFGLDLAVAVEGADVDLVATAAAGWVPSLAPDGASLGVAWGTTLSRVARALPAAHTGTPVVQICGAIAGLELGTGPVELALQFGERLGGPVYALPAPARASASTQKELRRDATVAPTVAQWRTLGAALVGIGDAGRLRGSPRGAVGHLLVHTYTIDGEYLSPGTRELPTLAASWRELRRTRVFAVASGETKRRAVLGALRTGVVNGLFCDAALGEALLAADG
jgi:DNA-binding transcriptional regulator LsrR (DeoR family)